ncbi:hypothetical protein [Brevibacterium aurantiacum]|uniref:Uncharacterized protein n=1 Tax=Brevibacterium aurantiacum TaxID=273384 RepID=A0A556CJG9_BREAU|nr:hypothetical protein [Brevibacterium aurantiacum]TSI17577.1 hypothetical protein FO013_05010 [Brevibacterium aurantiacum]
MSRINDYIAPDQIDELRRRARTADDLKREYLEAKEELDEYVTTILERGPHGTQRAIAEELEFTREWLRRTGRRYYRSIIRRTQDGRKLISMPANNVTADRDYEIRDKDVNTEVVARVTGQELLDARREQLDAYKMSGTQRNNIAVVDVSHLIAGRGHPQRESLS